MHLRPQKFPNQKHFVFILETPVHGQERHGKTVFIELFKTKERIRILRYVAKRSPVTATAVPGATGTSKPLVSRYLRLLAKNGFCVQHCREYTWNQNARSLAAKRLLNTDLLMTVVPFPEYPGYRGLRKLWTRDEYSRQRPQPPGAGR